MEVPSSDLRHRRHDDDEETVAEQPCQRDMSVFKTELLLIDRDLARNPLKLAEMNPAKYNYSKCVLEIIITWCYCKPAISYVHHLQFQILFKLAKRPRK